MPKNFYKPRFNKNVVTIVVLTMVIVAGIGYGTFTLLSQLKPVTPIAGQTNGQSGQAQTSGDTSRQKAEQLIKHNDLAGAKAAYQTAETEYAASNDQAAAADAKYQITIIDATANATTSASPEPTPKLSGQQ